MNHKDYKCERCGKPATVHMTEIFGDQKAEKHLCDHCAAQEGGAKAYVPINQLLEEFILRGDSGYDDVTCDVCGLTYTEFCNGHRLGCPHDYEAFARQLVPQLRLDHEGACEHIGKVPHRAGGDQEKQTALLRLRAELKRAIGIEDYERAAALRDQIHETEGS